MSARIESAEQLLLIANWFGQCKLDGVKARLDINGRRPVVVDEKGRRASFNPSTILHVIQKKKGEFFTHDH